ncbi:MAG: hypothetical protein RL173_1543 [Fibrobacterota bacterium]|jgi:hypothetical protein
MNLFRFRQFLALGACGLLATLWGCDKTTTAGGSDEIDTRLAVDRTGRPVAGARISLVKAGDSTGTALAISATGSDGSFPSFVVPDGFYSVLLRDPGDSLGRFVDSLHVVSRKLPSGRDTLLSLGSVRGVVRLGSGDSPTSVTVGLLGTDILANVRADGSFKIELVPGGLYTLGAATSLDGYGRLYKRIQLADGQNLVLADTLVLPFSGLPVPAGLRVVQDTTTGNVSVTWSRVVHPDLMGYVLERLENGTATFSGYLTDTSWTDSLGAYWEAMPMYGPWPSRDVAYRVRSRSLSGAVDTKSVALAITAKPPEWTKSVDSVKVTMTTDSGSGVTTLNWNTPKHPELLGWKIRRSSNFAIDCEGSITSVPGEWSDSKCVENRTYTLDSSNSPGENLKVLRTLYPIVEYQMLAVRKSRVERIARLVDSMMQPLNKLVSWRDSGSFSGITQMRESGGWVFVQDGSVWKGSRNGVDWMLIPYNFTDIVADHDSIWLFQILRDNLSSHKSAWRWVDGKGWGDQDSSLSVIDSSLYYFQFYYGSGAINIAAHRYDLVDVSVYLSEFSLKNGHFQRVIAPLLTVKDVRGDYGRVQTRGDELYCFSHMAAIDPGVYQSWLSIFDDSGLVKRRFLNWAYSGSVYPLTMGSPFGSMIFVASTTADHGHSQRNNYIAFLPENGDAIEIPLPKQDGISISPNFGNGDMRKVILFRGELWVLIDGHLWKGKLNLPK